MHYSLSAPLRMPALASLTCNLGFSLDVVSDIDDESIQLIQDSQQQPPAATAAAAAAAAAAGSSRGSREAGAPAASSAPVRKRLPDLLPALTQLILVDPACVPDVIERATASKAACRQLQHLELPALQSDDANDGFDYNTFNDQQQQQQAQPDPAVDMLQRLRQLRGLRQLATVVRGQRQLDALVAAAGSQLQGLTVTCQFDETVYVPLSFEFDTDRAKVRGLPVGV